MFGEHVDMTLIGAGRAGKAAEYPSKLCKAIRKNVPEEKKGWLTRSSCVCQVVAETRVPRHINRNVYHADDGARGAE